MIARGLAVGLLAVVCVATFRAGDAEAIYSRSGPYLDFGAQVSFVGIPEVRFGRRGIARVRYSFGWRRNPVTTANIGLQAHAFYKIRPRRAYKRRMLAAARGLVRTQREGVWEYDFPFTVGGMGETLRPPWISAMAQGLAMSLLTRAYGLTGHRRYLVAARRAVRPFRRSVPRGGVVRMYEGHRWYEEYPTPTPSYVLNGFGFTLLGLYDLSRWSPAARRLYVEGRKALTVALPAFDAGFTSYYHLGHLTKGPGARFLASPAYNHIHVQLLDALHSLGRSPVIAEWRERFRSYDR